MGANGRVLRLLPCITGDPAGVEGPMAVGMLDMVARLKSPIITFPSVSTNTDLVVSLRLTIRRAWRYSIPV